MEQLVKIYKNMLKLIKKEFPEQYIELLRSLGTIGLNDSLNNTYIYKGDIFTPLKVEESVRRLSRF